ncbi:MAG: hypothetical protein ACRDHD_01140 [Candidatus Limnocylindria bacterium]
MTTIVHHRPRTARGRLQEQPEERERVSPERVSRERVSDVELGLAAILVGLVVLLASVLVPIVG